jgi:nitrogenase subunit NifH
LNKVRKEEFDLGFKAIEGLLESSIISAVMDDKAMREALYTKKPVVHLKPKSHSAKQYHHLARKVHQDDYQREVEELKAENKLLRSILKGLGFK